MPERTMIKGDGWEIPPLFEIASTDTPKDLPSLRRAVGGFLDELDGAELIAAINELREAIAERSPFSGEPV